MTRYPTYTKERLGIMPESTIPHLPIINCDDCGACCFEQGSPPFMPAYLSDPIEDAEDIIRQREMPAAAADAIATYHRQLLADEVSGDAPCCWLDRDTNRCRWYEFRPQICRDLDCGSEGCRSWRDEYNIDVARLQS